MLVTNNKKPIRSMVASVAGATTSTFESARIGADIIKLELASAKLESLVDFNKNLEETLKSFPEGTTREQLLAMI